MIVGAALWAALQGPLHVPVSYAAVTAVCFLSLVSMGILITLMMRKVHDREDNEA